MTGPLPSGLRLATSPDFVALGKLRGAGPLLARARLLGTRIETRDVAGDVRLAGIADDAGLSFVFRYGVVVTIGSGQERLERMDTALAGHVFDQTRVQETETASIVIRPDGEERPEPDGQIYLADSSQNGLLLVATVLAHSVVLSRDELLLTDAFQRIAPLVAELREAGSIRLSIRAAMRLVGEALSARHRVMGTVSADERPDLLWDHPEYDRLYARLEAEYELKERSEVLDRKFAALGDFTEVLLDIVQVKRAVRLEAAVIGLIAFEIILSLVKGQL